MKLMRNSIFETNSSSTNSLILGDSLDHYRIPEKVTLLDLLDGRDFEYTSTDEKFSCLAYYCDKEQFFALCYKLYEFGVKEIVLPNPKTFGIISDYSRKWLLASVGEIDDSKEELCSILENDEDLKRWLFNPDSYISGEDDNF